MKKAALFGVVGSVALGMGTLVLATPTFAQSVAGGEPVLEGRHGFGHGEGRHGGEKLTEEEKAAKKAQHEAIRTAIEADDYGAFRDAVGDDENHPLYGIDTEAEFDRLQEMHDAKEAGDHDTAKEIAAELGIERHDGHKKMKKRLNKRMNKLSMLADFETFSEARPQAAEALGEDGFAILKALINAILDGDTATADELKQDLRELLQSK